MEILKGGQPVFFMLAQALLPAVFFVWYLSVFPSFSYAAWGYHGTHAHYRYHDRPHYGLHMHHFYRDEYFPVWTGRTPYYYDDGIYYTDEGEDYVVAAPPVGAVVGSIPSDFQPVAVNGVTYYTDNGTYYVHTPSGYQVVSPPQEATGGTQNTFRVNVPNNKGGYVIVVLKRSGNGFVGPQGEFYSTFPRISQLKLMYGR